MKQIQQEDHSDVQFTFRERVFSNLDELLNELNLANLPRAARGCGFTLFIDCTFLNLDISCWVFSNCIFERTKFEKCYLDGAEFFQSELKDCRFVECSLRRGLVPLLGWTTPGGGQARLLGLRMNSVIFSRCDLTEAYIKASELNQVEFQDCVMSGCDFLNCRLRGVFVHRCVLNATRFLNTYFWLCDISNSSVSEETQFDLSEDHTKDEAYNAYNQVYKLFKGQGLDDISIEYLFLAKQFERLSSTKWHHKLWLRILQFSCGYGEKPDRVVITSVALIIVFAIIQGVNGLNFLGAEKGFGFTYVTKCLYYSSVTFATLGDGEVSVDALGMFLNSLEAAFGMLLTAIGTASFYKKLTN